MKPFTWGELKKLIDNTEGVTDETEIVFFDFHESGNFKELEVVVSKNGLVVYN